MYDQACTHAARFQRDIQGAAWQAVVAGRLGRRPNRHHLGMGTGVAVDDRPVEALANHLAMLHQHGPHRYLAQRCTLGCQGQRQAHEFLIAAAIDDLRAHQTTAIAAIRPVSMWSMTWQWNIQVPGLSATRATCARSFLPSR